MNKKQIFIGLGILALAGIGIGIYLNKKKKATTSAPATTTTQAQASTNIPGNATNDQFNKLVEIANKVGSDWFKGVPSEKMKDMLGKWKANLTKSDAEVLITTIGKKEKDWTATEKINFSVLFAKWTGKKL